ncbi:Death-associated inhibitor of apoptosis 2 [Chionoecetes opilio]|uniref:Death-associated inhibitor of apoptosis 2 n=1 Tax=Chionoecetes opilio TaxID=41210 RepID=A0A8J4YHX9_CHIOP|nr:Death-associated inhibitor of apoptosis 2 [Chionoecetes opilio]
MVACKTQERFGIVDSVLEGSELFSPSGSMYSSSTMYSSSSALQGHRGVVVTAMRARQLFSKGGHVTSAIPALVMTREAGTSGQCSGGRMAGVEWWKERRPAAHHGSSGGTFLADDAKTRTFSTTLPEHHLGRPVLVLQVSPPIRFLPPFTMQYDGLAVVNNAIPAPEPRGERRFHALKGLLLESVRRQTFVDWKVSFVNPDKLAAAGFLYLRTMDHVQCAFCRGIVGFWDEGDEPSEEHRKHFPNCPFVMGSATGNVPIAATPDTDEGRLYHLLNQFYAFKMANTRPSPLSNYHTDSTRVSHGGEVAFPQLTLVRRLQTFAQWPKDTRVEPEQLAEAGFFYTGLSDFIQCFHCGGGLFGWRADDDLFADHARYYPCCNFIRNKRSEQGVPAIHEANTTELQPSFTKQEAELLLHHPLAKRLITLGLSPVSVREALKLCVEKWGFLCSTVTEALELVFDYDEKERRKSTSSSHDGLLVPQPDTQVVETKQPFLPPTPPPEQNNQPTASDYSKILQEVQALRREVQEEERRLVCRQCGKERVEVVFQPCSHFHLCADCARPMDSCITCGTVVRGTLRPILG